MRVKTCDSNYPNKKLRKYFEDISDLIMAEGTYEYECMRAELLGIEKPNYEEFMKNRAERKAVEEEECDLENLKDLDLQDESMTRMNGKLDELNNILKTTQRKINSFRTSCGSLTNLLKIRTIGRGSSDSLASNSSTQNPENQEITSVSIPNNAASQTPKIEIQDEEFVRKSELARALDSGMGSCLNNLDAMIEKAETANLSMSEQNKKMRRALR